MITKSIEERIKDLAKLQLRKYGLTYYTENESMNAEIDGALKKAPSKGGGCGGNFVDIRLLLKSRKLYPIMIEVKGTKDRLIKQTKTGEFDYSTNSVKSYAVNGAIHYAKAIVGNTDTYKEVIAIGINGYEEAGVLNVDLGVYYVSEANSLIPKKVDVYTDLSFLAPNSFDAFIELVEQLKLTDAEREVQSCNIEDGIVKCLKELNQLMHDDLQIPRAMRVSLVAGMIMAGLGVYKDGNALVSPLSVLDLKGNTGEVKDESHDGTVLINKIKAFLSAKGLPEEKKDLIVGNLRSTFIDLELWKPINNESKLKIVYAMVQSKLLPLFKLPYQLDFTGKLFNVLNEWSKVPDSAENDVVLTPRYVTEMMAKLAEVNRNSYVWDYAVGSAGFLISSMKLMIQDAENNIHSPDEK